ncbi:MAG TPA: cupin domain-containing protein [Caulobacteraceae bacterium]|jgi:mannose-6-phosphate isomerase-like protein (cupin superfamily)|nr:cupin domain-containing protein [Caulobacteraceae bacterium]
MPIRLAGLAAALIATAAALPAVAQPAAPAPAPASITYASAADVATLIAKAARERKPDQPTFLQPLQRLAPYTANLEYRVLVGPAAVHEKDAELFYVIDGGGTLVTGGKLIGETRTNPNNLSGTGIAGGESKKVAKGDFFFVPENTPHWFSAINGTLVLMSVHVPRAAAGG